MRRLLSLAGTLALATSLWASEGCASAPSLGSPAAQDPSGEVRAETTLARFREPDVPGSWSSYGGPGRLVEFRHPPDWKVVQRARGSRLSIITAHPMGAALDGPVAVHGPASATFLSILPQGFGTEAPMGASRPLSELEEVPRTGFALDQRSSSALLLESGEVWGLLLYPKRPPPGWDDHAFVFAQFGVEDARVECVNAAGQPRPSETCDPLDGDQVLRFGKPDPRRREETLGVLSTLKLHPL